MNNEMTSPGPENTALLKKLEEFLGSRGTEAYIVGGFVRDLLIGRPVADIDIAVKADAQETASAVAELLGGKYVMLDEKNGVARVVIPGEKPAVIDFSAYQRSINKDLSRRDFTIDAMAVSLAGFENALRRKEIVDPLNGRKDIENKLIRQTGETVFILDPVRLLRAVRLSAELGFTIEPVTEDDLRDYGHLIFEVAGERIHEELLRLMALPGAAKILLYLDDLGMLTSLFPELEESRGVVQPKEHYWNVFDHSLKTVSALEFVMDEGGWSYVDEAEVRKFIPLSDRVIDHLNMEVSGGSTRRSLLKLAALLHDTGKPGTKHFDENGRMRFFGHGKEGADLVVTMLEHLRFSVREIRTIETAIVHHMRPTQMSQEGMPTDRAIYRYFRDTGLTGLDILFLNLADHLAVRGPELDMEGWKEHTALVEYVVKKNFEKENIINPPKVIDGYDIMKFLGVSGGPMIGNILEAVREAQASGEVRDRDEALSYAKKIIQSGDFSPEGEEVN